MFHVTINGNHCGSGMAMNCFIIYDVWGYELQTLDGKEREQNKLSRKESQTKEKYEITLIFTALSAE